MEDMPYKCSVCNYRTSYSSNLKKHEVKHKREAEMQLQETIKKELLFSCEVCDFTSATFENLLQHKKLHTEELFKCNHCEFSTSSNEKLQDHIFGTANTDKSTQGCEREALHLSVM